MNIFTDGQTDHLPDYLDYEVEPAEKNLKQIIYECIKHRKDLPGLIFHDTYAWEQPIRTRLEKLADVIHDVYNRSNHKSLLEEADNIENFDALLETGQIATLFPGLESELLENAETVENVIKGYFMFKLYDEFNTYEPFTEIPREALTHVVPGMDFTRPYKRMTVELIARRAADEYISIIDKEAGHTRFLLSDAFETDPKKTEQSQIRRGFASTRYLNPVEAYECKVNIAKRFIGNVPTIDEILRMPPIQRDNILDKYRDAYRVSVPHEDRVELVPLDIFLQRYEIIGYNRNQEARSFLIHTSIRNPIEIAGSTGKEWKEGWYGIKKNQKIFSDN